jgi:hypothetical protein
MNDFFTMSYLMTFAGMVLAVNLLTQATKTFFDFATKWLVLVYAVLIQSAVLIITGNIGGEPIFLGLINSVLVAMTAIGAYQVVTDKRINTEKVNPSAEESANDK